MVVGGMAVTVDLAAPARAEVFLADDVEFLARAEVGLRGGDVFGSDAVGGDEDDVGLANALGVIVGNGEVGEVDVFGNGAFDDDVDEVAGKAVADDEDFAPAVVGEVFVVGVAAVAVFAPHVFAGIGSADV